MIPVAGRRKGQAPPSMPPLDPKPSVTDNPVWLFADGEAPAAVNTVRHTPIATEDKLAFLDDDDDDDDDAPLPLVTPSSPVPTHYPSPMPQVHVTTLSASLPARLDEIREELHCVQGDLIHCEERIALLESGEDESSREVKLLEEEVSLKKEEEKRVVAALELQQQQRQQMQSEAGILETPELTSALDSLRTQYENEMKDLNLLVERQEASLLALEERRNAMSESISATEQYEGALEKLQEVLRVLIQCMSTGVCVRIKPILVGSIRDAVAQSALGRQEMLTNDCRRRHEQLDGFQNTMNKGFSKFCEERRARHQTRLDSIFGHATMKARSDLERRLTETRQQFVESQRTLTAEAHRSTQRAIDEMVRRSEDELGALEKRLHEEVKRTEERCTAELAHHARLFAAEREAVVVRQHHSHSPDEDLGANANPVYRDVMRKLNLFQERLEQLKQSVSLDIQELSIARPRSGIEFFSAQEREAMLVECEQKTQRISHQLETQWERFRAAVVPLEQCVNSMAKGLQEGRVKVATMQQGTECLYRSWNQDVRRELSCCLTSSGASYDPVELQSSLAHMTRVVEEMLGHLQPLMATLKDVRTNRMGCRMDVDLGFSALTTQHATFNDALHSIFDEYERLSRATAEVEAKRTTLEVATADYTAAKGRLDRERAKFEERLKVMRHRSEKLSHVMTRLKRRADRKGCGDSCFPALYNMVLKSTRRNNASQGVRPRDEEEQMGVQVPLGDAIPSRSTSPPPLPPPPPPPQSSSSSSSASPSPSHHASGNNAPSTLPTNADLAVFFTFDNVSSRTPDSHDAIQHSEGRQLHGSSCTVSSNRVCTADDGRSLTTPSTSN